MQALTINEYLKDYLAARMADPVVAVEELGCVAVVVKQFYANCTVENGWQVFGHFKFNLRENE